MKPNSIVPSAVTSIALASEPILARVRIRFGGFKRNKDAFFAILSVLAAHQEWTCGVEIWGLVVAAILLLVSLPALAEVFARLDARSYVSRRRSVGGFLPSTGRSIRWQRDCAGRLSRPRALVRRWPWSGAIDKDQWSPGCGRRCASSAEPAELHRILETLQTLQAPLQILKPQSSKPLLLGPGQ